MKSASRVVVGVVATISFTVAWAEEPAPSNADVRHVVALADGPGLSTGEYALDAYAGRYDAADGAAFFVYREGDSLTIELPQQFNRAPMRLHDAETGNAFTAEGWVRVVFECDSSGRVVGLLLYAASDESIAANRTPLPRGIVTIHDLSDADVSSSSIDGLVRSL